MYLLMANSRNTLNITSNSPYSAHVSVKIALTYGFLFIEKEAMSEITWLLFIHSFEQLLFYEKSVKILHSKMKAGAI